MGVRGEEHFVRRLKRDGDKGGTVLVGNREKKAQTLACSERRRKKLSISISS